MLDNIVYSIIVPIYNGEKYIKKCLNSLIHQTYKNIEIILIDDGSYDKTEIICDEFLKKDQRIKYYKQSNQGVSSARNKGLLYSTGAYITFVDIDDFIDFNTVLNINNIIIKTNVDICKYSYYKVCGKIKKEYKFKTRKDIVIYNYDYANLIYDNVFLSYDLTNVCNAFFKRDLIKNITFDEKVKYAEDYRFMIEAFNNSKSIYFYNKPLYYYAYVASSATNSINLEKVVKKITDNIDTTEYISKLLNITTLDPVYQKIYSIIEESLIFITSKMSYAKYLNTLSYIGKMNSNVLKYISKYSCKKEYINLYIKSLIFNIKKLILKFVYSWSKYEK